MTTLVIVSIATVGVSSSQAYDDRPFRIDFDANSVTDAAGNPLRVISTDDRPTLSVAKVTTAGGVPGIVTRRKGLPGPVPDTTPRPVDPEKHEKAKNYQGALPAELVDTEFVEGDETLFTSEMNEFQPLPDASLLMLQFIQAITPTTVSFAWEQYGGAVSYQILRDGVLVDEGTERQFSQSDLIPGQTYAFEVISLDADNMAIGNKTFPITTISSEPLDDVDNVEIAIQRYSTFAYRTFIEDAQVHLDAFATLACGQWGNANMTFGGDARSYSLP